MLCRLLMLGLFLAVTAAASAPASAQVDDFLCSTFSYKCDRSPALPPPQLAPAEAPAKPTAAKHATVAKKHRIRHAKAETGAAASEPAAK